MSDHRFYLASAYGVFALALLIEVLALRRHRARAHDAARAAQHAEDA
jgi:heme exporter protein D